MIQPLNNSLSFRRRAQDDGRHDVLRPPSFLERPAPMPTGVSIEGEMIFSSGVEAALEKDCIGEALILDNGDIYLCEVSRIPFRCITCSYL